jgi:uncharacterized membrane protein
MDRVHTLAPLAALVLWTMVLIGVRVLWAESVLGLGLYLNLALAVIPVGLALLFKRLSEARGSGLLTHWTFAAWILFLPNAPYLVTDLFHVQNRPGAPLWYDALVLATLAGTGVCLGFTSVAIVQDEVRRKLGSLAGWSCAVSALVLAGFGIWIGRFLRWNSWDVAARPLHLVVDLVGHFTNPDHILSAAGMTAVYGATLVLGYVALRVAAPGMALPAAELRAFRRAVG